MDKFEVLLENKNEDVLTLIVDATCVDDAKAEAMLRVEENGWADQEYVVKALMKIIPKEK